jgi:Tfp pilus assembly protein FimV
MTAMTMTTIPALVGPGRSSVPVQPRAATRRQLRLTRRGRAVVVLGLLVLLVVGAFAVGRVSSSAATGASRASHQRFTVVQPGQSLWSIARQAVPAADPRVTIERILDLNSLTGAAVVPGQRLALPSR